jgi:type I restriction enzyme R subunit
MNHHINESTVESAALSWLQDLGYVVRQGQEIGPDGFYPERTDYSQVVLDRRMKAAIERLNPDMPAAAREDALRVAALEHESRNLAESRDALLPRLVSGEMRVEKPETEVKESQSGATEYPS